MQSDDWSPSDEMLIAFERGQLDDADIDAVARWLETNPDGEARLLRLTRGQSDDAVEALRKPCEIADELSQLSIVTASVVARSLQSHLPDGSSATSLAPIRDYQLLKELGHGAMGTVYLARHQKLQRDVAIKVLAPELSADATFASRFEREMAVVGQMDHPNLVRAHDAGREGERLFLVMELLDGMDAGQLVRERGPLPVAEACELIRQAAKGLQYAHDRGMVHRDIKPSNIFVGRNGVVKVIDLGMARVTDRRLNVADVSTVHTVLGTPDFMAPEQWTGTAVDGRADIYSLGCTLFMLLAGERVFSTTKSGDSWVALMDAHRFKPPRSLSECRPDTPADLVDLVKRMLAKNPSDRPASAQEVADALASFGGKNASPVPNRSLISAIPQSASHRFEALIGLLALALLVVLWSSGWFAPRADSTSPSVKSQDPADGELAATFKNPIGMSFARIPRGKAWLGGGGGRPGEREVSIPMDFYLGTYEVTQAEWQRVMGANPSSFSRAGKKNDLVTEVPDEQLANSPVETVSWHDVQQFLMALNRAEPNSGWTYRLPTVVEWEYACRGGPMSDRHAGSFSFYLDQPHNRLTTAQANFQSKDGRPGRVGSYKPNPLGLHDMYGNIYEWCDDAGKIRVDAIGRLVRGGAFWMSVDQLNSGVALHPHDPYPDVGFRVARVRSHAPTSSPIDMNQWRKEVAAMSAQHQVIAVETKMRERNPSFYDTITAKISGDVVTELSFVSDNVKDVEPLRALAGLRILRCAGWGGSRGGLEDLAPLKGLPLTQLDCRESLVTDLTPLDGMPLQKLSCNATMITDLTPLSSSRLRELDCSNTPVADLSPLVKLPLVELNCEQTRVDDLAPLKELKQLAVLRCRGARITDLTPLRGMSLQHLTCDIQLARDGELLKSISTLQTINGKPIAQFWQEADSK